MGIQNLPNIGDKLFLMRQEVVVTKVYTIFQLIGIRLAKDNTEFFVDASAITELSDNTNSFSIKFLRRNRIE